ncbi:unnamed protein product [Brassicogethes aeneus]|uniref:NADH dehydrogenase [ubiquinone] 1 alpha subcomplex subunit 9, mitochondrial n=1 Tax=Brassicogethes aeneus TaxID=1431903 RepID=A0A9P0BA00_BRAAE|nr:unnamed protein product [Brassicogethes aeneus]
MNRLLRNHVRNIRPYCSSEVKCDEGENKTTPLNLATYRRGTGGRASFSGIVATIFGASGFLGRYVCNRLGKIGSQQIIPYRDDGSEILRLKVAGDLGQVLFTPFHLRDEESIEKAVKYSNVVVNLIGRDWETKNFKFQDVHVDGAARLARLSKEAGVERFIHFSALNCSEHPTSIFIKGGSKFLISKREGECAVLEEFPEATIFRPADIYGQEDRFVRYYVGPWRRFMQYVPIWQKGEQTIKQPVYCVDVAAAVVEAIKNPETKGKIYQAVGPKRYLLSELVDYFFRVMRKGPVEYGYTRYDMRYDPIFKMKITLSNMLSPNNPIGNLHWERLEREHLTDNVDPDLPTLEDLGVHLTTMENQIPYELKPWTYGLYHGKDANEPYAPAEPPKVSTY